MAPGYCTQRPPRDAERATRRQRQRPSRTDHPGTRRRGKHDLLGEAELTQQSGDLTPTGRERLSPNVEQSAGEICRPDAPTKLKLRFEKRHASALERKLPRSDEARDTTTDDDDARTNSHGRVPRCA